MYSLPSCQSDNSYYGTTSPIGLDNSTGYCLMIDIKRVMSHNSTSRPGKDLRDFLLSKAIIEQMLLRLYNFTLQSALVV